MDGATRPGIRGKQIVEISAGVFFGMLTREEALAELDCLGHFGDPVPLAPLLADLGITGEDLESNLELRSSLRDCSGGCGGCGH